MDNTGDGPTSFALTHGMRWDAHHTWHPDIATQIDGFVTGPLGSVSGLDLASLDDEDAAEVDADLVKAHWREGKASVDTRREVPTIIVPREALSFDVVYLALRHWAAGDIAYV